MMSMPTPHCNKYNKCFKKMKKFYKPILQNWIKILKVQLENLSIVGFVRMSQ